MRWHVVPSLRQNVARVSVYYYYLHILYGEGKMKDMWVRDLLMTALNPRGS